MTDLPTPSRRSRWAVPILAAAGVLAVVAVGIQLARHRDQPAPLAVAPLPAASPGVVSAGYVGSRWRLTAVTDRRGTTEIPASLRAWLDLATNGKLVASDGINAVNADFQTTRTGFDVYSGYTTLAGYGGNDPVQLAAIAGIDAMSMNPPATSSASSNASAEPPTHVTVLAADRQRLNVQAGGVRLAFVRSGPASEWVMPSSAPR